MEKLFKVKSRGSSVKTELVAGLTTFLTMAYIIMLNPNLIVGFRHGALGNFGADAGAAWNGVFLATCLASGVTCILMALVANKPFGLAPGMGLNAYFAMAVAEIASAAGCAYLVGLQAALCLILIEGLLFLILSLFNIREKIIASIPLGVRLGIGPAIGMMLMNLGFGSNAGVGANGEYYVLRDFFGPLSAGVARENMDGYFPVMVLTVVTMFAGLFLIISLSRRGVKGAVLLGMLASSAIYWAGQAIFLKQDPFASLRGASWLPPVRDMLDTTFLKFDFKTLMSLGWLSVVIFIVSFCMIDMSDTIGTVLAGAERGGMVDEKHNVENMKQILIVDAVGTVLGSAAGTSSVTTYVESISGIEAGGRTGLTALTTGVLFLACAFISPLAAVIPPPATSAALIYVGILLLSGLRKIDFSDISAVAPVFIMIVAMPVSGSIGHSIGLGLIAYTVIKLFGGKGSEVPLITYIMSGIFLLKFFLAL